MNSAHNRAGSPQLTESGSSPLEPAISIRSGFCKQSRISRKKIGSGSQSNGVGSSNSTGLRVIRLLTQQNRIAKTMGFDSPPEPKGLGLGSSSGSSPKGAGAPNLIRSGSLPMEPDLKIQLDPAPNETGSPEYIGAGSPNKFDPAQQSRIKESNTIRLLLRWSRIVKNKPHPVRPRNSTVGMPEIPPSTGFW